MNYLEHFAPHFTVEIDKRIDSTARIAQFAADYDTTLAEVSKANNSMVWWDPDNSCASTWHPSVICHITKRHQNIFSIWHSKNQEASQGLYTSLYDRNKFLLESALVVTGAGTVYSACKTIGAIRQKDAKQALIQATATSVFAGFTYGLYNLLLFNTPCPCVEPTAANATEIIAKFDESYKIAAGLATVAGVSASLFGAIKTMQSAKNKRVLPTIGFAAATAYAIGTAYFGIKNAQSIGFNNFLPA